MTIRRRTSGARHARADDRLTTVAAMRHAHAEGAARGGAPSPISVSRFDRPGRGVLPRDAPATCAGNRRRRA
ncbi:hypothetical protein BMASAVP1_1188 [Burkholderia mallei SAVP1]|nr:hypothetical protein BMASAVP1_1188 [Burkholderia mallei SAVP1]